MELFGGMANMLSEELPLSFLFVVTNTEAPPNTKEAVLVNWIEALKSCGIMPEFTLSDKDVTEISALNWVWPRAKHQLCLWHMLRALKRRLANNREPPAFYGSADAKKMFAFIDRTFVPLRQMSTNDKVCIRTSRIWPATLTYCRQWSNPLWKTNISDQAPCSRLSPSIYTRSYPNPQSPNTCWKCEWTSVTF